jgi:hypothetical protein
MGDELLVVRDAERSPCALDGKKCAVAATVICLECICMRRLKVRVMFLPIIQCKFIRLQISVASALLWVGGRASTSLLRKLPNFHLDHRYVR